MSGVIGAVGNLNDATPGTKDAGLGTLLQSYVVLLRELHDDHATLRSTYGVRCLTSAGLAIGSGSKKKVLIANTVQFTLGGGTLESKTTAEVAFTNATHDITAHASLVKGAYYLLSLVTGGTATITKGTTATSGSEIIPATPASSVAIGYVLVRVAAGVTDFAATDDDLDAGHLTVTYTNLVTNPSDGVTNTGALLAALTASKPAALT